MFSHISTDLFLEILRHLPQSDLSSCLRANKSLHTVSTPLLWTTVTLGGPRWTSVDDSFLNSRNQKNWRYVRNLHISKAIIRGSGLKKLFSFLEVSENISSLRFFGIPKIGPPTAAGGEIWAFVVSEDLLSLLHSTTLFSRILHLSFKDLMYIPLCSLLAQCQQLRTLHLMDYGSIREVSLDEWWPGRQLEHLTLGPSQYGDRIMSSADLAVLLQSNKTDSSLSSLYYFRCTIYARFPSELQDFLNAAPSTSFSLRHLSIGSGDWKYIVNDHFAPKPKRLLPLSDLPFLQSLSMVVPFSWIFQKARCKNLNYLFDWLCGHMVPPSSLPLTFTDVIIVSEVPFHSGSQSKDFTTSPLPSDLTRVLISSQLHFEIIIDTSSLREENVATREYWKCSQTLKLWGKGLSQAGKMTLFRR
ncbi:hypothetical protein DL96DRAFT_1818120 [Flagelloscypha sp. PMI_526]|nr:hypothetical protein DL96DRAFT_1818120 [Flagelloscypha sp. PMI_526]